MTVLFLYTELADYFLKCCAELSKTATVHIIRWPVNKEAPFQFDIPPAIKLYDKNAFSFTELQQLVSEINPDSIVCSGWVDKEYLKLVKPYFKKIPTVLACDTQWKGSAKQYLATVLSRMFLLHTFSHGWVPGKSQATYLKKLGFKPANIKENFYCCDLNKFNAIYAEQSLSKAAGLPKRFLYVGRYYDFKGVTDLWEAFIQLQNEAPNAWELWCLGTGNITPVEHPRIKHFGFVQPADLAPILGESGVFVLPSRFEPWGVVVQEYAAAGFPLMLSSAVGAREAFLEEGKNGFSFSPGSVAELKTQLKKIINLTAKDLLLMSEKSHQLAQKISPEKWSHTLTELQNGRNKK
jgi:glycosyltransferase involved in cell wall biosynthesis